MKPPTFWRLPMSTAKQSGFCLVAIILIGAAVRYLGITFGLPMYLIRPDELTLISRALQFGTGDLNPHYFNYPSLYMYILFFFYGVYFAVGSIIGLFNGQMDFLGLFNTDPSSFILISRSFSALCGVLTIYVVYRIGMTMKDKLTGLTAALFTSLAYLHVRDSHFGVTDVTVTLFIACSVLFMLKSLANPATRYYFLAGLFAGLSTSTKYLGIVLPVPMLIAHYYSLKNLHGRFHILRDWFDRRLVVFCAALILFFLIGTPYALLDYKTFFSGFFREVGFVMVDKQEEFFHRGWFFYLWFSLFHGLGWPFLLASIIGIIFSLRNIPRKSLVLLAFPLVFYLITGKSFRGYVRYAIPFVPFLSVTAAVCVTSIIESIKLGNRYKAHAGLLITVLLLIPSISNIIAFDRLLLKEDTRIEANNWISESLDETASVLQLMTAYDRVLLKPAMMYLIDNYLKKQSKESVDYHDDKLVKITNALRYEPGYRLIQYDNDTASFVYEDKPYETLPDYIMLSKYPLFRYDKEIPPYIEELIDTEYELHQSFVAIDTENGDNLFDQYDAFYIPFAGFEGVTRPGPNIFIYKRK